MESSAITVSTDFNLPSQPSIGTSTYIPLGGDGFVAPFAAYAIRGFRATGDASSGRVNLRIGMDPRFCSLVQYVSFEIEQGTSADADYRIIIGAQAVIAAIARQSDSGLAVAVNVLVTGAPTVTKTWGPIPSILQGGDPVPIIEVQLLNVLADEYFVDAMIFLFNIRVRELTPMGPLLWARGAT